MSLSLDQPAVTVEVPAASEWRFEVPADGKLVVKLVSGTAEIFGTELALGQEYEFTAARAAVYTWKGCVLEYSGSTSEYLADNTPMPIYANIHFALEPERNRAATSAAASPGPCLLVVGPPNSGKSTVSKIVAAYANKVGRYPLLVSLDPKEPVFTPMGSLTAAPVSHVFDVEAVNGWGSTPVSGPSPVHPKQPIGYYYGLATVEANAGFFRHNVRRLAAATAARQAADPRVRISGTVIDAPASLIDPKDNYDTCASVVNEFKVTAIAVVGHERLYSELARRFADKGVAVLRLPKSGGVVDNDDSWHRTVQRKAIQQYFYGLLRQPLSPFTITARLADLTVWRVLEDKEVTSTDHLPGGDDAVDAEQTSEFLTKIEPSSILQNCVLAIVNASPSDPQDVVADAEVLGYVHVVEADDTKKTAKILLPVPGRLPARPLILGDWRYME